jgi:LPPG:FO 2-phospho-L-lactate transferase
MTKSYIALCGGVGGSKLADGLARILPPEQLTIVVNTADDFDHLGLRICPDIDTVTYMLGGISHPQNGWGRGDETWAGMEVLAKLGGPTWFQLGDRDIALHLHRTARLRNGASLAAVTRDICNGLGIRHVPVPMSEQHVETMIDTDAGELSFQDYFVRHRCAVEARNVRYVGVDTARPASAFMDALLSPSLAGIVVAPSNPILSIAPILALPNVRQTIDDRRIPVVAVSPLIGGKAVKGPADKMMAELGYAAGSAGIAAFYGDMLDVLLIDLADRGTETLPGLQTRAESTLMKTADDRERIARRCLEILSETTR